MEGAAGNHTLPSLLHDLVRQRVGRLDETAQVVAQVASTLEQPCAFDDVAAIVSDYSLGSRDSVNNAAVLESTESLMGQGIIDERRDGYAFHHPIFRVATYESMSKAAKTCTSLQPSEIIWRRLGRTMFRLCPITLIGRMTADGPSFTSSRPAIKLLDCLRMTQPRPSIYGVFIRPTIPISCRGYGSWRSWAEFGFGWVNSAARVRF